MFRACYEHVMFPKYTQLNEIFSIFTYFSILVFHPKLVIDTQQNIAKTNYEGISKCFQRNTHITYLYVNDIVLCSEQI